MSSALEIRQLDAEEKECLRDLLNYTERHPDGWRPTEYNGMHEYSHKDVHPIVKPIIETDKKGFLMRISGSSRNLLYRFSVGALIPISGERYSLIEGNNHVQLALEEKGRILKEVAIRVEDNCILTLLWIVNI